MSISVYPTPTSGGGDNLGALGGGSLTWSTTTSGALAGFSTTFPMAAGAYEFNFRYLTAFNGGDLKLFLSKNGSLVTSSVVTTNARYTNSNVSVYAVAPSDFDTIELYNNGNTVLASTTSSISLSVVAGQRAVTSAKYYNVATQLASFATTTTTSTYALNFYPQYYSALTWNQAGTKAYYLYTTYPSGSYTTNTFAPEFYEYDVATNTHTKKANLGYTNSGFFAAFGHNMFMDASGYVYVQGGWYWNGSSWADRDDLYRWNPANNTWTLVTNAGPNGKLHGIIPDYTNGVIYFLAPGANTYTGSTNNVFYKYTISSNTYSSLSKASDFTYTYTTGSYTTRTISSINNYSSTLWFVDWSRGKYWHSYSSTSSTGSYPIFAEYAFSTNTWTADTAGGTITRAPDSFTNTEYIENGTFESTPAGTPIKASMSFWSQKWTGQPIFYLSDVNNQASITGTIVKVDTSGTKSPLRNKALWSRSLTTGSGIPYSQFYNVNDYLYFYSVTTNTFTSPASLYRLHLTNDAATLPAYAS